MKEIVLQALMNTDITFEEMTKIENYLNELEEDRKLLLFDNFMCLDQGEIIGQVSQEVIDKMPKAN